jgi:hypothetical protein
MKIFRFKVSGHIIVLEHEKESRETHLISGNVGYAGVEVALRAISTRLLR